MTPEQEQKLVEDMHDAFKQFILSWNGPFDDLEEKAMGAALAVAKQAIREDVLEEAALIADRIDPAKYGISSAPQWNYNMDEAPRDGQKLNLLVNGKVQENMEWFENQWALVGVDQAGWYVISNAENPPTAWMHRPKAGV